ncbi:hypothetical protein B6N60_02154 [Richelia sinica FACHB-800]|uniref:Uncharacterized protein n=1 Tax=Richelia sinica FACHB-800 TaxID=1357546 RepID=A0A975T7B8_9NOST|nr:hypothetical protein B6N60_02154 [Richelia sinica FACHB-800]
MLRPLRTLTRIPDDWPYLLVISSQLVDTSTELAAPLI